jgi:hypothetical protein
MNMKSNMIWNGNYSLKAYSGILDYLQKYFPLNYTVGDIPQILSQIFRPKFVIRHDVLASLESALAMAALESERGIRTSYMISANTSDFSLEDTQTWEALGKLHGFGHEVGILIDTGAAHPPLAELEMLLRAERARFEKNLSFPVLSVVFPQSLPQTDPPTFFVGGMINAEADPFMLWSLSDLQGPWPQDDISPDEEDPERCLLQLLIHPHLWKSDTISSL